MEIVRTHFYSRKNEEMNQELLSKVHTWFINKLLQTSPQYSLTNAFFGIASLAKIPQPATSDGAKSNGYKRRKTIGLITKIEISLRIMDMTFLLTLFSSPREKEYIRITISWRKIQKDYITTYFCRLIFWNLTLWLL